MRSNCHLEAWRAWRRGEASALIFRPTQHSKMAPYAQRGWWSPLRAAGAALQWLGAVLTQAGAWLRTGGWWHVQWEDRQGRHWEFHRTLGGSLDTTTQHWLPPIWFAGVVQEVDDD